MKDKHVISRVIKKNNQSDLFMIKHAQYFLSEKVWS